MIACIQNFFRGQNVTIVKKVFIHGIELGNISISRPHSLLGSSATWFPEKTEPRPSKCLLEACFFGEGMYLFITGENRQFPVVPF